MMPRTHFMVGALVASLLAFKFNITFGDVIIGAFFGSIIDIDHVFTHWQRTGKFSAAETSRADVVEMEHGRTPYIHGYYGLFVMAIPALIAYYFFGLKFGLLV